MALNTMSVYVLNDTSAHKGYSVPVPTLWKVITWHHWSWTA